MPVKIACKDTGPSIALHEPLGALRYCHAFQTGWIILPVLVLAIPSIEWDERAYSATSCAIVFSSLRSSWTTFALNAAV